MATRKTNLNAAPGGNDAESWVLCSDGTQRHNGGEINRVNNNAVEGDILVSIDMNLTLALMYPFIGFHWV